MSCLYFFLAIAINLSLPQTTILWFFGLTVPWTQELRLDNTTYSQAFDLTQQQSLADYVCRAAR